LHPDLYEPLAQLIARVSRSSQIWVTTHTRPLAEKIAERCHTSPVELTLVEGETWRVDDPNMPRRPHRRLHFGEEEDAE
jgi:predicted ATPase